MATKKEIKDFLNIISKKEYNKKYPSLSNRKASIVRKKAVQLAFSTRK